MWLSCWLLVVGMMLGCDKGDPTPEAPVSEPLGGKADFAGEASVEIDWAMISERCARPAEDEPILYSSDFIWDYSPETMASRFEEIYASDKRLKNRAYFDLERGGFVLPHLAAWGGDVVLPKRLIENVRRHIEKALSRGYAEFVFFPDMGHSHLFIPQEHWDERYAGVPVAEMSARYSDLFADPELKVLYHTAEQLTMVDENEELLDDRHVRWRFFTRNPVGDNAYLSRMDLLHEPTHSRNTSRKLEGHHYLSAGFNMSASKQGCFPFVHKGVTMWFDISLKDLEPESSGGAVYY